MNTKPKNSEKSKHGRAPMSAMLFVVLWTLFTAGVGWLLMNAVADVLINQLWSWSDAVVVTALTPGLTGSLGQALLLKYALKKDDVWYWIPVSLTGFFASAMLYVFKGAYAPAIIRLLTLIIPAALVQSVWLHYRVKNAWLWAATGMISALLFNLGFQNIVHPLVAFGSAAILTLHSIVTGVVMRQLWTQERAKDKRIVADNSLQANDDNAGRIERLQEMPLTDDEASAAVESLEKLMRS